MTLAFVGDKFREMVVSSKLLPCTCNSSSWGDQVAQTIAVICEEIHLLGRILSPPLWNSTFCIICCCCMISQSSILSFVDRKRWIFCIIIISFRILNIFPMTVEMLSGSTGNYSYDSLISELNEDVRTLIVKPSHLSCFIYCCRIRSINLFSVFAAPGRDGVPLLTLPLKIYSPANTFAKIRSSKSLWAQ